MRCEPIAKQGTKSAIGPLVIIPKAIAKTPKKKNGIIFYVESN